MNVLLICPSYSAQRNASFFPLGLASIAAVLKQKGHHVICLNFNNFDFEERLAKLTQILDEHPFDVVGTGGLSVVLESVRSIFATVRQLRPHLITVLGGGVISADPSVVFNYLKPEYGVIGEGEETMAELLTVLEAKDLAKLSDVQGIVYWNNGEIQINQDRPAIPDLQQMPFPDLDGFGMEAYLAIQEENSFDYHLTSMETGRKLPIAASRSCPYKCTFCFHPVTQLYRKLPAEVVVDQILLLKEKYKINTFAIYDELFDYETTRIKEFCERLVLKQAQIKWSCQLRVNKVELDLLKLMKKAGCYWISYGFESGSEKILTSMRKRIRPLEIEKAAQMTREAKITIQANFLYGDPAETAETVQETQHFKDKNHLDFVDWGAVIPFPGTELYKYCLKQGLITDPIAFTKTISNASTYLWNTRQPPINMTQMPDEQFHQLYLQVRESNEASHRQRLAIVESIETISQLRYLVKLCCPSCQESRLYTLLYPPEGRAGQNVVELAYFGVRGLNILCIECHRKMHFPAWFFPDIHAMYQRFQMRLDLLSSTKERVVFLPAMDRYFGTLSQKIDLSHLCVCACLDMRSFRIGQQFFSQEIQLLTKDIVQNHRHDTFVLLPASNPMVIQKFLLDAGILTDRIVAFWDGFQPEQGHGVPA
ncbi:MAG: B12-binding domain-containing radical SAM protein [Magnetococcus sp. DMHC-6]